MIRRSVAGHHQRSEQARQLVRATFLLAERVERRAQRRDRRRHRVGIPRDLRAGVGEQGRAALRVAAVQEVPAGVEHRLGIAARVIAEHTAEHTVQALALRGIEPAGELAAQRLVREAVVLVLGDEDLRLDQRLDRGVAMLDAFEHGDRRAALARHAATRHRQRVGELARRARQAIDPRLDDLLERRRQLGGRQLARQRPHAKRIAFDSSKCRSSSRQPSGLPPLRRCSHSAMRSVPGTGPKLVSTSAHSSTSESGRSSMCMPRSARS
jgi:hypothetical protein